MHICLIGHEKLWLPNESLLCYRTRLIEPLRELIDITDQCTHLHVRDEKLPWLRLCAVPSHATGSEGSVRVGRAAAI